MKRIISLCLGFVILSAGMISSCSSSNTRETEDTTTLISAREADSDRDEPIHDFSDVDISEDFGVFMADAPDEPWVLANNIPFTSGNVNTHFLQFVTDMANNEISSTILNDVSTIYRPRVRHYAADQEGYTVYEITYVQQFPLSARLDYVIENISTMFNYHDVGFLDYYTGTIYPTFDLSTSINSYSVSGTVVYNGEEYDVSYYVFREDETTTNDIVYDDNNNAIWNLDITLTNTIYFVVPNGYDGIVMYAYTGENTISSLSEALDMNDNEFHEAEVFDNDINDYAFISIPQLG